MRWFDYNTRIIGCQGKMRFHEFISFFLRQVMRLRPLYSERRCRIMKLGRLSRQSFRASFILLLESFISRVLFCHSAKQSGGTLLNQRRAKILAGCNRFIIGRVVGNDTFTGECDTRVLAGFLPVTHPLTVAPAVGAKQSDLLTIQRR